MPMESEKPTGPPTQHGGGSGSGVQRNDVASTGATQTTDEKPPEAPDVDMGAEDSCEAQVKRAKTIMDLEKCALGDQDDVYDEAPGASTNLSETTGENTTDEEVVAPEVTEEPNQLQTLGRPFRAPAVDKLMHRRCVYSLKTHESLDDRKVAKKSRTRAAEAVFTRCFVRDPKGGSASRHQNDPWQVR